VTPITAPAVNLCSDLTLHVAAKEVPLMYSTIMLVLMTLGSLLFLIDGLRNRGKRRAVLEILGGLFGLLFAALDMYKHTVVASWQSRGLVAAYYVGWQFSGGACAGMLLYVAGLMRASVLLTASTVFLVAANVFLIPRHAIRLLCMADGLFGGLLIASLILIWFEHHYRQAPKLEGGGATKSASLEATGVLMTDENRP